MESRYKETENLGIFGVIGNIFLLVLKGFIGLFTNSQAMIADAINSFGDIFSSLMTYIGNIYLANLMTKTITLDTEKQNTYFH